jgi:hypothetical protein
MNADDLFLAGEELRKMGQRRMMDGKLYKREKILPDDRVNEIVAEFQLPNGKVTWERESRGRLALTGQSQDKLVMKSIPRTEKALRTALRSIRYQLR